MPVERSAEVDARQRLTRAGARHLPHPLVLAARRDVVQHGASGGGHTPTVDTVALRRHAAAYRNRATQLEAETEAFAPGWPAPSESGPAPTEAGDAERLEEDLDAVEEEEKRLKAKIETCGEGRRRLVRSKRASGVRLSRAALACGLAAHIRTRTPSRRARRRPTSRSSPSRRRQRRWRRRGSGKRG